MGVAACLKKFKLRYAFFILLLVVLAGCGGDLKTTLVIESDGSGNRVMQYEIERSDLNRSSGDSQQILQVIKDNCPPQLNVEDLSSDEKVIYIFTLNFSSIEDYQNKVRLLTGNEEAAVSFNNYDSLFMSGIAYNENFSSRDLMSWMESALVGGNYLSQADAEYIFEESSIKYNIAGVVIDEYIDDTAWSIDALQTLSYSDFSMNTIINSDYSYDREISFSFAEELNDEVKAKIESFFNERLNKLEFVSYQWAEKQLLIKAEKLSKENLDLMMQAFYNTNEAIFSFGYDSESADALFVQSYLLNEHFYLDDYLLKGEKINLHCTYNFEATKHQLMDFKRGEEANKDYQLEEAKLSFDINQRGADITLSFKDNYQLNMVEMMLVVLDDTLVRTVSFSFAEQLSEGEYNNLVTKLNNYNKDNLITVTTLSNDTEGLRLVLEGVESLSHNNDNVWNLTFNCENKKSYTSLSRAILQFENISHYDDYFSISPFTDVNEISYSATIQGFGELLANEEWQLLEASNIYTQSGIIKDGTLHLSIISFQKNYLAHAYWIVVILGFVGCAAIAIYEYREVIKNLFNKVKLVPKEPKA